MAKGLFKPAKAAIRAFRVGSRADLRGDLRYTQSQLDAIYANLGTSGKGISKALTATQQRNLVALQRAVRRGTARSAAVVENARESAVERYGTALGPSIAEALRPAAAVAKGTRAIGVAGKRAEAGLVLAGQTALGIQQSASKEARAGADYALASAFKQRSTADAAMLAEMQFKLQTMRIDHRFAMDEMRRSAALQWKYREMELEKLHEFETEDTSEAYQGLRISAEIGADSYTGLHTIFNTPLTADDIALLQGMGQTGTVGQTPNATQAGQLYIGRNAIAPESNEALAVMGIARAMWGAGAGSATGGLGAGDTGLYGVGTSDEARANLIEDAVVDSILSRYPQYKDKADDLRSAIHASVMANVSGEAVRFANRVTEAAKGQNINDMSEEQFKEFLQTVPQQDRGALVSSYYTDKLYSDGWWGNVERFVDSYGAPIAGSVIGFAVGGPAGAAVGGTLLGGTVGGIQGAQQGGGVQGFFAGATAGALKGLLVGGVGGKLASVIGLKLGLGAGATAEQVSTALALRNQSLAATAGTKGASTLITPADIAAAKAGGPNSAAWKAILDKLT